MNRHSRCLELLAVVLATSIVGQASGDLLLYEPFNYTVGENLGGVDTNPDLVTPGTPTGQTNTSTGGGTWYAHGTAGNYQSPNDTVVSSGNLSYAGLASSVGNSVSYGSATANLALYANSIDIPGADVSTGSLYASFIIRIKSHVTESAASRRHSPASFVTDVSDVSTSGADLSVASGFNTTVGAFWMRRDPLVVGDTNFSPGKSSGDGIGQGATGPSAGWQNSTGGVTIETNQFGDTNGQTAANFADPGSYQTYFVVLKYEFDAQDPTASGQSDTVSLWMNPGSGTLGLANGEALASAAPSGNVGSYYAAVDAFGTATTDAPDFKSFALIGHRQNTDQSIAVDYDELRIGTTWADVTPAAAAADDADFDGDGDVDGADFLTWQRGLGLSGAAATPAAGNANSDTVINGADLAIWRAQFGPGAVPAAGAIPEPATVLLAVAAGLLGIAAGRRRRMI